MIVMLARLFTFWALVLPLVAFNGVYEGAKVVWFLVGGFGLFVWWLIQKRNAISKVIKPADYFYFGWLVVLTVASLRGVHPLDSILGGSYRHQGVLFFLTLWVVGKTIKFHKGLAWVIGLEAMIIIFQRLVGEGLVVGRPIGTFGEPNAAAGFLVLGMGFVANYLLLLSSFIAILLTGSRAAILAGLVILASKFWKGSKKAFLLVAILVSSMVFYKAFGLRPGSLFENRIIYWDLGIKKIMERPWLGYGAESGEVVYDMAYRDQKIPLYNLIIDRSHNIFIDVAMWSGIVGLTLFFAWLGTSFISVGKDKKMLFFAWLIFAFLQPLGVVHWVALMLIWSKTS